MMRRCLMSAGNSRLLEGCDKTRWSMKLRIHWLCSSLSREDKSLCRCSRVPVPNQLLRNPRPPPMPTPTHDSLPCPSTETITPALPRNNNSHRRKRRSPSPRKRSASLASYSEVTNQRNRINRRLHSRNLRNLKGKSCSLTLMTILMRRWLQPSPPLCKRVVQLRISLSLLRRYPVKQLKKMLLKITLKLSLLPRWRQKQKSWCSWLHRTSLHKPKRIVLNVKEQKNQLKTRRIGQRKSTTTSFLTRAPSLRFILNSTQLKCIRSQIYRTIYIMSRLK